MSSIFTVGNLLTLGAVLLVLIIYHQINRRNRALDKLREYGRRLKEDLASFVAEKEGAVKDYAVSLEVQRKAAKELLKRLALTNDEMTARSEAVNKLDARISSYDASLSELYRMTDRVQENLNRLQEEGPFVESAAKRVSAADEKLKNLEKGLKELTLRFERENTEALGKIAQETLAPLRSSVANMQSITDNIARQVGEHRAAVDAAERRRETILARDLETINRTLKTALEQAGARADKLEDAALIKLREQAMERIHHFQTAVEEKFKNYQESAKTRVAEVQGLLRAIKDEWKNDNAEQELRHRGYKEEWKQEIIAQKDRIGELEDQVSGAVEQIKARLQETLGQAEAQAESGAARNQELLAGAEKRLKDGFAVIEEKIQGFEEHSAEMANVLEQRFFTAAEEAQRRAQDKVDERLREYQMAQAEQYQRLESLADDTVKLDVELRRYLEETKSRVRQDFALFEQETASRRETVAGTFTTQAEELKTDIAGLERELVALKERAYENVSEKLRIFEDDFAMDLSSRSEEINHRLEDWKKGLDGSLAGLAEAAREERRQLENGFADELRRRVSEQREKLNADIERVKTDSGERLAAIQTGIDEVHAKADAHQTAIFTQIDERAQTLDADVKDADRRIKEFIAQTKLFEQAETLKKELEQRVGDLQGNIDRLNQYRVETAELEAQFVKIKRLEDEVNAKMTRFLSEKRRIELMENDFNRLIHTSLAVEEKLNQVNASDDTLQAMQVQIRKLSDALADTEEQYQRIEKKNQTLETTNAGIDRNFKALQDAEIDLKRFTGDLDRLADEQERLSASLNKLSGESERVQGAAEKLALLADELPAVEKRIQSIQVAREWLARTETRLTELDKDIQDRLKLVNSILKDEGGKPKAKGAPPIGTRETVVKLARQGWKVDEIARAVKLSKGEVELIMEISPKD